MHIQFNGYSIQCLFNSMDIQFNAYSIQWIFNSMLIQFNVYSIFSGSFNIQCSPGNEANRTGNEANRL